MDKKQQIIKAAKSKKMVEARKAFEDLLEDLITVKVADMMNEEKAAFAEAVKRRIKRIRGGKLQKKIVTDKQGFKIKDGKVVRMKQSERRKRKKAAKKSVRKKRGKTAQITRARKRSNRKRQARNL